MENFLIKSTPIKNLMQGEIISKKDERGYFERVFCIDEFKENFNLKKNISQISKFEKTSSDRPDPSNFAVGTQFAPIPCCILGLQINDCILYQTE